MIIPQTKNPTNICGETCPFVPYRFKRTEGHYTGRISLNSYIELTYLHINPYTA